jgi:hypothetical protein
VDAWPDIGLDGEASSLIKGVRAYLISSGYPGECTLGEIEKGARDTLRQNLVTL